MPSLSRSYQTWPKSVAFYKSGAPNEPGRHQKFPLGSGYLTGLTAFVIVLVLIRVLLIVLMIVFRLLGSGEPVQAGYNVMNRTSPPHLQHARAPVLPRIARVGHVGHMFLRSKAWPAFEDTSSAASTSARRETDNAVRSRVLVLVTVRVALYCVLVRASLFRAGQQHDVAFRGRFSYPPFLGQHAGYRHMSILCNLAVQEDWK